MSSRASLTEHKVKKNRVEPPWKKKDSVDEEEKHFDPSRTDE